MMCRMDVTPIPPQRRTDATRAQVNRELLERRLAAVGAERPTDAARALGIHRQDYYRLLAGQEPRLHRALRIARALDVDPLDLWPEQVAA
jgi:DNA-binding phage protein